MFTRMTIQRWSRVGPASTVVHTEDRPHLVPQTREAEEYAWQQAHGDLPCVFGDQFQSFSLIELNGRQVVAFRFLGDLNLDQGLDYLNHMFVRWLTTSQQAKTVSYRPRSIS